MKKFITMCVLALILCVNVKADWKRIGPTGDVRFLAKTSKGLFASNGSLIKSTDFGITWSYKEISGRKMETQNFIQFGDTLLIFYANSNYKMFSYDGGETWKGAELSLDCSIFNTFKVGNLIIQIDEPTRNCYKSEDLGQTWTKIKSNLPRIDSKFYFSDNVFYCNQTVKKYFSTDTCQTWSEVPTFNYDNYFLAKGDYLINYKFNDTAKAKNFYYSTDAGKNWEEYKWGTLASLKTTNIKIINGSLIIRTNFGDYYTTDKGLNWIEYMGELSPLTENNRLEFENYTLAATNGGFYKKNKNDSSWTMLSSNFDNVRPKELAVNNNVLYSTTYGAGLFKSNDFGKTWMASNKGLKQDNLNSICFLGSYSFVSTNNIFSEPYSIYRGDANGDNWKICENAPNNVSHEKLRVYAGILYSCTNKGIYFSKDTGLHWSEFNSNFKNNKIIDIFVNDNVVLIGSDSGLYRSADFGKSYKLTLSEPKYSYTGLISEIDGIYYVPCGLGFYKSSDQGQTWKSIKWDKDIYEAAIGIEKYNNYLFLYTTAGVYYSLDLGEKWQYMSYIIDGANSLVCKNGAIYRTADYIGGILEYKIPTEFQKIQLEYPKNFDTNIPTDSTLWWKKLDNALVYTIQLAKDIDFKDLTINKDFGAPYRFFKSLSPATKYFWRVRAVFGDVKGEWSDVWSFTTQGINGVETNDTDAVNIYPNPVSDKLLVILNSDNADRIVKLVDNLGQTLFSQNTTANNLNIDVSKFYPGSYFVVVESGEKRIVKKIEVTR